VPSHDPQSIAEKTALILENQDLRAELGRNACQMIEEEFSWEKVISRIIDVFKEVTTSRTVA